MTGQSYYVRAAIETRMFSAPIVPPTPAPRAAPAPAASRGGVVYAVNIALLCATAAGLATLCAVYVLVPASHALMFPIGASTTDFDTGANAYGIIGAGDTLAVIDAFALTSAFSVMTLLSQLFYVLDHRRVMRWVDVEHLHHGRYWADAARFLPFLVLVLVSSGYSDIGGIVAACGAFVASNGAGHTSDSLMARYARHPAMLFARRAALALLVLSNATYLAAYAPAMVSFAMYVMHSGGASMISIAMLVLTVAVELPYPVVQIARYCNNSRRCWRVTPAGFEALFLLILLVVEPGMIALTVSSAALLPPGAHAPDPYDAALNQWLLFSSAGACCMVLLLRIVALADSRKEDDDARAAAGGGTLARVLVFCGLVAPMTALATVYCRGVYAWVLVLPVAAYAMGETGAAVVSHAIFARHGTHGARTYWAFRALQWSALAAFGVAGVLWPHPTATDAVRGTLLAAAVVATGVSVLVDGVAWHRRAHTLAGAARL